MSAVPLQVRLDQMVADAVNGADALALLQRLSIFLTEKFDWNGVYLVSTPSLESLRTVETLIKHGFVYDNPQPHLQPWRWRRVFRIDAEVAAFFQPTPTDEEQHFAHYAAYVLIQHHGVKEKEVDLYLALVQWTLEHKPEIGMGFALVAAKRYGGTDPRLNERLIEIARQHKRIDIQVQLLVKQALGALRRYDYEAAESWYAQAVRFDVPLPVSEATHLYFHALKFLGRFASQNNRLTEARAFYERAIALREQILPDTPIHRHLLLALCHVTQRLGDDTAYQRYSAQVSAYWPPWMMWVKAELERRATALDPLPRQRALFADRLAWTMERRSGISSVLWHWGRFEFEHGDTGEGCALCRMALLELDKEIETDHTRWWGQIDVNQYSHYTQLERQYREELQTNLLAMDCDESAP